MREILSFLGMNMFVFIMNCIFVIGIIVAGIGLLVAKNKPAEERPPVKRERVEIKSEISRRKQEEDELTAIMNESNSDDLYAD